MLPARRRHRTLARLLSLPGAFSFFLNFLFRPFCLCPHSSSPYPRFQFFFSPLPNAPQRSQWPCLQSPVLPSPLCPDQGSGDSPPPAPGPPGLWAVGEISVFNQPKAQHRVKGEAWSRGVYADFWSGRPQAACPCCCFCQRLPSGGPPGGQRPGAAFLALSLGSQWPGVGQSSPFSHGGRKAIMSRDRG